MSWQRKLSINNNKQFILNQLLWIGISFGISLAISLLLPFPVSLAAILGVFILLNMYMRRIMLRRMSSAGATGIFGSMSPIFSSNNSSSLKYYCISCGTQHKEIACPGCGSKMKKVGF
jgi:hypothetical protein